MFKEKCDYRQSREGHTYLNITISWPSIIPVNKFGTIFYSLMSTPHNAGLYIIIHDSIIFHETKVRYIDR